ncbi:transmembrane protein 107 isoform X4 [Alligator mississippiensis]|uniref:transmembrane protein 107 isoform X4 n=1 Tax=Alligator mississippiensis TaxID=8496 RepID=UPI002877429E|nr:transmembrane protein 107 isoform X4 [Alligator mississippiensis]
MAAAAALVPWRFLALVAHLVIVIGAFWAREDNVRASLPLDHTPEEYGRRDTELVVALSVTLGLFAVELAGFLSGVSMFNPLQGLLSLGAHCGAAISLSLFLSAHWESASYWYILGTCSFQGENGPK